MLNKFYKYEVFFMNLKIRCIAEKTTTLRYHVYYDFEHQWLNLIQKIKFYVKIVLNYYFIFETALKK